MIGIVLVAHGRLAEEFKAAVEHVVGPQQNMVAINISNTDDMETKRADIVAAVADVDSGTGVVVLTDLFGGTPSNMAISLLQVNKVEVIAGMNLPMLVKLVGLRDKSSISEAAELAQEAGRKYIHVASKVLQGNE